MRSSALYKYQRIAQPENNGYARDERLIIEEIATKNLDFSNHKENGKEKNAKKS